MGHHVVEFDQRCKSCKGAGIYVGMAERDGAAIVCHTCKGEGWHHVKIEYDDFNSLQKKNDVTRVYQANPGIIIGEKTKEFELSDFGGIPYEDWLSGNQFPKGSENRRFTCPAWWYQTVDYEKKPDWDKCALGCSFSACKHFGNKSACWSEWDAEMAKKLKLIGKE